MALGGGNFTMQNKKLPGSYINFVSASRASALLGDRGIVALPMSLSWGEENKVYLVENADFIRKSKTIFGYEYTHEKLIGLREVFKNAQKILIYRLNGGVKASCTYATAKYSGVRGNDIKIVISANVDESSKFDVKTLLDTEIVDTQTVAAATALVNNDFVDFKTDATLQATAATPLTGGTDGEAVTASNWQTALAAFESQSFNVLGVVTTDDSIKALVLAYTKRLRNEQGIKFVTVMHQYEEADEKGVISVENGTTADLVYWVAGAQAGCAVNKSITNKKYDGELQVDTNYTQTQLENSISEGKLMLHLVGEDVRVLTDINTKVTVSEEENEDFKSNQTIRVLDQIGNDIAAIFNTRYLGIIPNDDQGRISFWNDVVRHHKELLEIRAIEEFVSDDVTVSQGNSKKDVVVTSNVKPTNAMEKLYMTVVVA